MSEQYFWWHHEEEIVENRGTCLQSSQFTNLRDLKDWKCVYLEVLHTNHTINFDM